MIQLWINVLGALGSLAGMWYATAKFTGSPVVATISVVVFVAIMRLVGKQIQAARFAEFDAGPFGVDASVSDEEMA